MQASPRRGLPGERGRRSTGAAGGARTAAPINPSAATDSRCLCRTPARCMSARRTRAVPTCGWRMAAPGGWGGANRYRSPRPTGRRRRDLPQLRPGSAAPGRAQPRAPWQWTQPPAGHSPRGARIAQRSWIAANTRNQNHREECVVDARAATSTAASHTAGAAAPSRPRSKNGGRSPPTRSISHAAIGTAT